MNPLDFLAVAERLCRMEDEASRRTAVGRTYFALFIDAREVLEDAGIRFARTAEAHAKVVEYLLGSDIGEGMEVGEILDDLRKERNDADYDMRLSRFDRKNTGLILVKGRLGLEAFGRIGPRRLGDAVRRHLQRTGQG